jgi:dienelactone hydrolase
MMNRNFLRICCLLSGLVLLASAARVEGADQLANGSTNPKADAKADFLKLIDRPRVPLAPEVKELSSKDGLEEFHFTYASDEHQRVPGLLIKQKTGEKSAPTRKPVVIDLHGTGGTKTAEHPMLVELAKHGFIAVAIDGRYHGERTKAGKGTAEYTDAILKAWHDSPAKDHPEHPFYFDTVWDVMRLIDYLETRDDVDPKRIGMIGTSKGGIETYFTAAVDPRIAVAVPCIGMQSFHWALENNLWQSRVGTIQAAFDGAAKEAGVAKPDAKFVHEFYDRVVPGIDGEFDGPVMAALIAPRPLFFINGDTDPRTPLPGLKLCTDAAETAYHTAGADDHFKVRIQEKTGHKVNADSRELAIEWFAKWLSP